MLFDISRMRTDPEKEKSGVWVKAGGGLELLIARHGNPEYNRYLQKLLQPIRDSVQGMGEIDPEQVIQATHKAFARHILLDWKNLGEVKEGETVVDDSGELVLTNVPYSEETAVGYLKIPDFMEMVAMHSRNIELFRLKKKQEIVKN